MFFWKDKLYTYKKGKKQFGGDEPYWLVYDDRLYWVDVKNGEMLKAKEKEKPLGAKSYSDFEAAIEKEKKKEALARKKYLCRKYGEEIGVRLWQGRLWIGMTSDMLLEQKGRPSKTKRTVYKNKTKNRWYYLSANGRRAYLTVILENGKVVSWSD